MAFDDQENFTTYIDAADASTTYIGKAPRGSATSQSSWQIKKIVVNGTVTSISYANGTDKMEHIWDNRATYTYS